MKRARHEAGPHFRGITPSLLAILSGMPKPAEIFFVTLTIAIASVGRSGAHDRFSLALLWS